MVDTGRPITLISKQTQSQTSLMSNFYTFEAQGNRC